MLVIPAMHIRSGCCTRTAVGEPGTEGLYPVTPVEVARLWRGENAKALHVVCLDFAGDTDGAQLRQMQELVHAVDIAIQLGGVFRSEEHIRVALEEIGVYRVVLDPAIFPAGDVLDGLLRRYGPRRIVVGMDIEGDEIILGSDGDAQRSSAVEYARGLAGQGVQRVLVTVRHAQENPAGPPVEFLLCLTETTNLSVTLNGSVRRYRDLKQLQELNPRKIDSVILDEVLYTNVFPCQRIWRLAEQQLLAQQRLW